MKEKRERIKKGIIDMEISSFEIPPSGDVLVLGKRCPIGSQAAKRMLDTVAPGQFEFVPMEDDTVEAIFVKKNLFLSAKREALIGAIMEEIKPIMSLECMMKIKCEVSIRVQRVLYE